MKRVSFLACLVIFGMVGCSKDSPAAPTPVACVTNNTAQVSFRNASSTLVMDILWDGIRVTPSPLAPGASHGPITTAASVSHTMQFRNSATGYLACSTAYPVLTQCSSSNYNCGG